MDQDQTNTEETAVECNIHVNEQVVTLVSGPYKATDIKRKAIEQNVSIEMDFVLSIEEEPRKTRVIDDEEVIVVEADICFIAVPDDDNS